MFPITHYSSIPSSLESRPVLVDDILRHILLFCDIHQVLLLSQVSKHFYVLTSSKHTWLAILHDLVSRHFIDLLPGQLLTTLSKGELISLVKRAVRGPRSWAARSSSRPRVSHRFILGHKVDTDQPMNWYNTARLLPGGQFVLVQSIAQLQCWSLVLKEVVWTYKSHHLGEYNWAINLDFDMVTGTQEVLMLLPIRTMEQEQSDRKNFIDIVRLDLKTNLAETLVHYGAPDTSYDNPFNFSIIKGNFAVVSSHRNNPLTIIRISTASITLLELPDTSMSHSGCAGIQLVSGYLIAAQTDVPVGNIKLHAWNLDLLFDQPELYPFPHISETVNIQPSRGTIVFLSIHQCPLREDSSTAWLLTTSPYIGKSVKATSLKFRILHRGTTLSFPSIKSLSALNFNSPSFMLHHSWDISYAGYADVQTIYPTRQSRRRNDPRHIICSLAEGYTNLGSLEIPDYDVVPHVSAYSGALTYLTDKEVVVAYYE